MYQCMKILISRWFYKSSKDAQDKLDVFYIANRLTDEEYTELTALVATMYTDATRA